MSAQIFRRIISQLPALNKIQKKKNCITQYIQITKQLLINKVLLRIKFLVLLLEISFGITVIYHKIYLQTHMHTYAMYTYINIYEFTSFTCDHVRLLTRALWHVSLIVSALLQQVLPSLKSFRLLLVLLVVFVAR